MINKITKDEIVGKTVSQFFRTKDEYCAKYKITCTSLIIKLENGLLLDLSESFDIEERVVNVDRETIKNEMETSLICFEEICNNTILAVALCKYYPLAVVLLNNNAIIHFDDSPFWSGAVFNNYRSETYDPLIDFWDGTPINVVNVGQAPA